MKVENRGGKRPGAGRPKKEFTKEPKHLTLAPRTVQALRKLAREWNCSISRTVDLIVRAYLGSGNK